MQLFNRVFAKVVLQFANPRNAYCGSTFYMQHNMQVLILQNLHERRFRVRLVYCKYKKKRNICNQCFVVIYVMHILLGASVPMLKIFYEGYRKELIIQRIPCKAIVTNI